jgi:aldehyde:ferredoxin oxidoreductase
MLDVAYKTTTRVNYVTSQENFKEVYDRTKKCAFVEFRPIKRVLNTI